MRMLSLDCNSVDWPQLSAEACKVWHDDRVKECFDELRLLLG